MSPLSCVRVRSSLETAAQLPWDCAEEIQYCPTEGSTRLNFTQLFRVFPVNTMFPFTVAIVIESAPLLMQHTKTKITMQDLECKTNYTRDFVVACGITNQSCSRPICKQTIAIYGSVPFTLNWTVYSMSGREQIVLRSKRELHIAMCAHIVHVLCQLVSC